MVSIMDVGKAEKMRNECKLKRQNLPTYTFYLIDKKVTLRENLDLCLV